jgi:hypothetical protein
LTPAGWGGGRERVLLVGVYYISNDYNPCYFLLVHVSNMLNNELERIWNEGVMACQDIVLAFAWRD